jgi:ribosomal protein S30
VFKVPRQHDIHSMISRASDVQSIKPRLARQADSNNQPRTKSRHWYQTSPLAATNAKAFTANHQRSLLGGGLPRYSQSMQTVNFVSQQLDLHTNFEQ